MHLFTFLYTEAEPSATWGEDQVSAYLKERFGLQIDIIYVTVDADRAIQSLCASDSLPDVLYLQRDEQFLWLIEQGYLLPLDEYLDQYHGYSGNISRRALELSRVRDHVYSLLSYSTESPSGTGGWVLRKDLYTQLGSPSLNTLEDVYQFALQTRGLVSCPILLGSAFDISQVYVAYGENRNPYLFNQHVYLDPQSQTFRFIGEDPAFAETVLYVRKLFENGLLPPDWFLIQRDQICAQLESGNFAIFASNDITGYPLTALTHAAEGEYTVISPPLASADTSSVYTGTYNLLGSHGISITKSARLPSRIYQYFDFIASDEGQRLTQFGPPGLLYQEINESGYPILTDEAKTISSAQRAELGLGQWAYPYMPDFTNEAFLFANNQCQSNPWSLAAQWRVENLNRHSLNVTDMVNIEPNCPGTERNAILLCEDLSTTYLPRMICASSDAEALALLDEMNRQVKATGYDFVLLHFDWFYSQNLSGRTA